MGVTVETIKAGDGEFNFLVGISVSKFRFSRAVCREVCARGVAFSGPDSRRRCTAVLVFLELRSHRISNSKYLMSNTIESFKKALRN